MAKAVTSFRRRLIAALLVALAVALPCQLTLRQLTMRAVGVRTGVIESVEQTPGGTRVVDSFCHWQPDELVGLDVRIDSWVGPIVASGETWFEIEEEAAMPGIGYAVCRDSSAFFAQHPGMLPTAPVTAASLILLVLLLLSLPEFIRWAPGGWWRRAPMAMWPAALVVVVAGVRGGGGGIRELLQIAEFAALTWVVWYWCREEKMRERLLSAVVLGAALMAVCGLREYLGIVFGEGEQRWLGIGGVDGYLGIDWQAAHKDDPGTAASRNALAFYTVLAVPLLSLAALRARDLWMQIVATLSLVGLLVCTLNLWLLATALLLIVTAAAIVGGKRAPILTVCTLAAVALALALIPRHGQILADSAAVYRYADPYGLHPAPLRGANGDDPDLPDWSPWQQKTVERQAALNAVMQQPLLGAGLGQYQTVINQYYSDGPAEARHLWVPKPAVNLMERDAHSYWLVSAVEGGVPLPTLLLLAIVWTTVFGIRRCGGRADAAAIWITWALALILGGFVASFAVRGLLGLTGLVLAFAAARPTHAKDSPVSAHALAFPHE